MEYTVGAEVLDGWKIVRQIGAGSFGKVYEVRKSSRQVETVSALKVMCIPESQAEVRSALSDGMDERSVTTYFKGFVEEILHEIAIMSTVKSHPNIVTYEDHHLQEYPNEIRWDILIRMELLTPLDQYQHQVAQNTALPTGLMLPLEEIVRLGRELSSALAFCQKKNIIHRDVKPENIFISEAGQFQLGDFGVAKTAASRSTGGSRKGTERYMAPEVYLNQPYGPTVDIYSLGLVMYRLLNGGRLPFLPPAPQQLSFSDHENALTRRMKGEPIPAPAMADERLAEIVLKACAFRSADRWHSAGALQTALEEYAGLRHEFRAWEGVPRGTQTPPPQEPEQSGTVGGGWRDTPQKEPEQGGTVGGGWRDAPPQKEPEQGGTVGGGWQNAKKFFDDAVHDGGEKQGHASGGEQRPAPGRAELLTFWKERLPLIRTQLMPHLYTAPDIPRDLLRVAMERAHDTSDPGTVLGMISLRDKTKSSLFENGITFGVPFWGIYVTETGFALLGKKKSDLISNVITARYGEVLDAKVTRDESLGIHKLKLLLEGQRIAMFSPDLVAEHYNYEALCNAILALSGRF